MIDVPVIETRSRIAGAWRPAVESLGDLHDPNTGEVRSAQLGATLADVEDALAAAHGAFQSGVLERVAVEVRLLVLEQWASILDQDAEKIARQDAMSTGNPIQTARLLARSLGDRVRSIAKQAENLGDGRTLDHQWRVRLLNRSLGPTLVLAPWNAPTFVAVSKLAAAFAAGSPVILKPSEWTPGGAQIAFESLADALDTYEMPKATIQLIHGGAEVGSALASDPRVRVITFTGGLSAGRAVARAAAETLAVTQLELGSNNPAIVLDDADLGSTAKLIMAGATRLNGQWCEAPGKILAPSALHDDLLEALLAAADALQIGNCFEEGCDLGPLAYELHRERLLNQISAHEKAGGTVHRAGTMPELDGWFFRPTIVTGMAAEAATTELFGPALTLHAYSSIDDATAEANRQGGGLDAFVFAEDVERALDVGASIRAGEVRINGTHMADLADGSEQTFWGTAGVGGHGPAQSVAFYQGRRVVGIDNPALPI